MSTPAPLLGRAALITGGGRGIGAAVAHALAEAGASVVVASRTAREIEAVAGQLRERGHRAHSVVCDVADEAAVEELARRAEGLVGPVDTLVLAAGHGAAAPFERLSVAEWRAMMDAHATGTFLCARALVPGMRARGFGRVIAIASTAGLEGARYISHYCAAKHAVVGFVRAIACELEGSGVTTHALCPGYVDTPMTEQTLEKVMARTGRSREAALAAVLHAAGQERLLRADEVASAALTLALPGPEASTHHGRAIALLPQGDQCQWKW